MLYWEYLRIHLWWFSFKVLDAEKTHQLVAKATVDQAALLLLGMSINRDIA